MKTFKVLIFIAIMGLNIYAPIELTKMCLWYASRSGAYLEMGLEMGIFWLFWALTGGFLILAFTVLRRCK